MKTMDNDELQRRIQADDKPLLHPLTPETEELYVAVNGDDVSALFFHLSGVSLYTRALREILAKHPGDSELKKQITELCDRQDALCDYCDDKYDDTPIITP